MGERGPIAKADSVGHHRRAPAVVPVAPAEAPAPPEGLLAVTRREWVAFWSSKVAGLIDDADLSDLRYLFQLQDQRERIQQVSKGSKALSKGSMGQLVINPMLKQLPGINREIRAIRTQLGLTPMARARMNVSLEDEKPTLAQLLDDLDAEDAAATSDDPRLRVLDGTG